MKKIKVGDLLRECILYGDIHEAPIPKEYATKEYYDNMENQTKIDIAATIHALTNNVACGSFSSHDKILKELFSQEVEIDDKEYEVCTWSLFQSIK